MITRCHQNYIAVWQKCLFVCALLALFTSYIWFTIAIARGGSGARAYSCSNSTHSLHALCVPSEWVGCASLSVQGYQVTTGPLGAHREREHLPSPSIHPSVRQAATQTERPWPMAHTTLFVRAVYFSSTQHSESWEYTQAHAERERANETLTHSLTLALPVCFFARRKGARIYNVCRHELIYWSRRAGFIYLIYVGEWWEGIRFGLGALMGDLTRKSREACGKSRWANMRSEFVVFALELMRLLDGESKLSLGTLNWNLLDGKL